MKTDYTPEKIALGCCALVLVAALACVGLFTWGVVDIAVASGHPFIFAVFLFTLVFLGVFL
jgi:hypothetical protein